MNRPKHQWKFERKANETVVRIEEDEIIVRNGVIQSVKRIVTYVNITIPLFDSLLCPKHSHVHRMLTGVAVMVIGVAIAKIAGHNPNLWIAGIGDMLGYAVHGVGLTPFAVYLSEKFERKN